MGVVGGESVRGVVGGEVGPPFLCWVVGKTRLRRSDV